MKKNFVVLLIIIIIGSFSFINQVKAENIFNSNDEASEKFDYENEDEDTSEDEEIEEEEEEINTYNKDDEEESNHSIGLVLVEIFCGIIGVIMVFLAFKTNES